MNPTVLLIGVDDRSPLTILDGNHRMAAAMLAQPPADLESFQFICGLLAGDDAMLLVSHKREYAIALPDQPSAPRLLRSRIGYRALPGE